MVAMEAQWHLPELHVENTTISGKELLEYVDDGKGREIRFGYDTNLNFTGWQDALGQTTNFTYNTSTGTDRNSTLRKVIHPKGNSPYEQAYQRLPGELDKGVYRVINHTDAYGNAAVFTYGKIEKMKIRIAEKEDGMLT